MPVTASGWSVSFTGGAWELRVTPAFHQKSRQCDVRYDQRVETCRRGVLCAEITAGGGRTGGLEGRHGWLHALGNGVWVRSMALTLHKVVTYR